MINTEKGFSFYMPQELWEKLKFMAIRENTSSKDIIIQALNQYIDKKTPKK